MGIRGKWRRYRDRRRAFKRFTAGEFFELHEYRDPSGMFDYEAYRRVQTEGNKRKIDNVFADERTIAALCDWLHSRGPIRNGLCHGSRNGAEVRWFAEQLPDARIVGTDISDTAAEHGLVQHDFHETREDWVGAFDFVYTNSHDHAYDPQKAFDAWVAQLASNGVLVIEHTEQHAEADRLDPFGVPPSVFPFFLLTIANGRYFVERIIDAPPAKPSGTKVWLFAIVAARES